MYEAPANRVPEHAEPQRAIASSLSELAAICGDLETEARRLARRIAPTLPGGSPFDALDKQEEMPLQRSVTSVPVAVQSHLQDELQSRIAQLRALAGTIGNMAERIEL